MSTYSSPSIWSASSSLITRPRPPPACPARSSHASSECRFSNDSTCSTSSPAASRSERHSCLGVGANVRRVAEPLGLLDLLAHVERVLDDDEVVADARHLGRPPRRRPSKWCGAIRETTRSKAPSANGRSLGAADHVGLHPGRGIGADDLEPGLAQPPRDVPAAGRDVERRLRRPRPSRRSGRDPRPRGARARSRYASARCRPGRSRSPAPRRCGRPSSIVAST